MRISGRLLSALFALALALGAPARADTSIKTISGWTQVGTGAIIVNVLAPEGVYLTDSVNAPTEDTGAIFVPWGQYSPTLTASGKWWAKPGASAASTRIGVATVPAATLSGALPAFAATPTFNLGTAPTLTVAWSGQSVGVTSLPPIPAGSNNIGTVTPLDGAIGTGSASAAAVFSNMPVSTAGYNSVYVQITGVGVGTVVFEQSIDGSTWSPAFATPVSTSAAPTASVTSLSVGTVYSVAATGQFRMRLSSYTSGTFSAAWVLKNSPRDGGIVSLTTLFTTALAVKTVAAANGGGAITRILSAATTNATSVKTSTGQLYHCPLYNNGAAAAYVKFYNKASAPTVGTDTPVAVIGIAPSGSRDVNFADVGAYFSTGIAYAITGGPADSDTTAVTANQVVGACTYN